MPQSAKQRKRTAARARTALPRKRRTSSSQLLARRGMIVLGIVIVASLIIAIVGSFSTSNGGSGAPAGTVSPGDPNQLIAAATKNPSDPNTIGDLADYYDKTGQYQQALFLYQRYLQLRPDDARARVSVGELLLGTGDIPSAQTQFTQAIALKPIAQTAARAHFGLGSAYAALQPPRFIDALNEFQQASDLDPTGEVGGSARDRLLQLQQQLNIATVTVIAPSAPAPSIVGTPGARPTGTP